MLISLGQTEAEETLQSEGAIVVTCEYCQELYRFTEEDVALMFAPEHPLH